jgi:hypothetical protein
MADREQVSRDTGAGVSPQAKPIVTAAFVMGWNEDGEFTMQSSVPPLVLHSMLAKASLTVLGGISVDQDKPSKIVGVRGNVPPMNGRAN